MNPVDPITENDLNAFIDGQLDSHRKVAVEQWLARNPDTAARVMADMGIADLLKAGLHATSASPARADQTMRMAHRLRRRLFFRRTAHMLRKGAVAAMLIGVGWTLNWAFPGTSGEADAASPVPVFADEAAEAFRTAIREGIADRGLTYRDIGLAADLVAAQPGAPVPVPVVPQDSLTPLGAQVVPWDGGDAVQAFWRDRDGELVVLFATIDDQSPATEPIEPTIAHLQEGDVVYWRTGRHAYALLGTVGLPTLQSIAEAAVAPPPGN